MLATVVLLTLCATEPVRPPEETVSRLGAVFAGGVIDLMTGTKRDVTESFGWLVSAPIGFPKGKRASEFSLRHLELPENVRTFDAAVAADPPALKATCAQPITGSSYKLEALLQGRKRTWVMTIGANVGLLAETGLEVPGFTFARLATVDETLDERKQLNEAQGAKCAPVKRDSEGEVTFGAETAPVRFEAPRGEPFPPYSDHLLDFAVDPELAVAGLMPAENFAVNRWRGTRPRTEGVLYLLEASEALSEMGGVALLAIARNSAGNSGTFFLPGRSKVAVVTFEKGSFTRMAMVIPEHAVTRAYSEMEWSLVDPRMPAEVILDMTPESARCLDALPKTPDEALATKIQKCFDLSLPDAGASYRVRRERWLEGVLALEAATENDVKAFCADQEALSGLPFFQRLPAAKKGDAGPLLTAKLGWEKNLKTRSFPGSLKFPKELADWLDAPGFMDLPAKELSLGAKVDTSFFSTLATFDRWELVSPSGPLVPTLTLNAAQAPLPNFPDLLLAAKLHLRRGLEKGKLVQAAADVRHTARLAFSTETLAGQSQAAGLLALELNAFEWAQEHQVATTDWSPIPERTIDRLRRVVRTAPAFYSPMAKEKTFRHALQCDEVTSCSGPTEVAAVTAGLETLLREPWKARYAQLLETIAKPNDRCSFALARFWAARPMVNVEQAKQSRTQEVIAGGMMSSAASRYYLGALERAYHPPRLLKP